MSLTKWNLNQPRFSPAALPTFLVPLLCLLHSEHKCRFCGLSHPVCRSLAQRSAHRTFFAAFANSSNLSQNYARTHRDCSARQFLRLLSWCAATAGCYPDGKFQSCSRSIRECSDQCPRSNLQLPQETAQVRLGQCHLLGGLPSLDLHSIRYSPYLVRLQYLHSLALFPERQNR